MCIVMPSFAQVIRKKIEKFLRANNKVVETFKCNKRMHKIKYHQKESKLIQTIQKFLQQSVKVV